MNISKDKLEALLSSLNITVRVFDEIDSTNAYLKRNASGFNAPALVCANKQTAGRGRLGKSFISPPGGCYFSLLIRPQIDVTMASKFTICAAVGVAQAIKELTGLPAQIKWVNDIYVEGKKICGILCETSVADGENLDYIICGIGINIKAPVDGFPNEIKPLAASISDFGASVDSNDLIALIVNNILSFSPDFDIKDYIEKYRSLSCVVGKSIKVIKQGREIEAAAESICDYGSLLVKYPNGNTESLNSGEISIKI